MISPALDVYMFAVVSAGVDVTLQRFGEALIPSFYKHGLSDLKVLPVRIASNS